MTNDEIARKIQECKDKQDELDRRFEELKKAFAELNVEPVKPPHPRWKPGYKETYCYINQSGGVYCNTWYEDEIDTGGHAIGNIFQSEDDTEFAAERLKVLAEMKEWMGNIDDRYEIGYNKYYGVAVYEADNPYLTGNLRFASYDDADNCIKAVGEERIKKYYFGVEE